MPQASSVLVLMPADDESTTGWKFGSTIIFGFERSEIKKHKNEN